ncbi:glycosyltransferase [Desulfoscipio gibsoniae DSM 7213]|uniref:Glycosyltransferase n=2 Tax=Desulfoscipio gibsoniae TaxID=102134 RepID=R4KKQ1_9FIRM|nr:glycosyltransferase [Desulfoscipio gibsoniae DSM 7213]
MISENARLLAENGATPVFLLDVDEQARDLFNSYAVEHIPRARVYAVNELLANHRQELSAYGEIAIESRSFRFYHYWRSYLIDLCLQYILDRESVDGIEFADYLGQGYVYFKLRRLRENSLHIPAWVRLHGSAELWDAADGKPGMAPADIQLKDMERFCLAKCDRWVASSEGVRRWYSSYYHIEKPCLTAPPNFQRLGPGLTHPRRSDPNRPRRVLFYGKMQRIKGPDLLVRAALEYLRSDDPHAEFYLVGPDVPMAGGTSMRAWLEQLIPEQFSRNFIFTGKIDPGMLPRLANKCDLAIFPSRVETFCLAAHELNWIGIPLLVSDIPGLDFFTAGVNCFKFDGTVEGLYHGIKNFFSGPDIVDSLRWQTPERGNSITQLYHKLSDTREITVVKPAVPGGRVHEPRVAIFITGKKPPQQTMDSLAALNYHNWRAWYAGGGAFDDEPGSLSNDARISLDEDIFSGSDGYQKSCWSDKLNAEFIVFLTPGTQLRPDFLRRAAAAMSEDGETVGVTGWAALDSPSPAGEKHIVPYDLNRFLIFTENPIGSLSVLWRRAAAEALSPDEYADPYKLWSYYCALAVAGKKIAVLPCVLLDVARSDDRPGINPALVQNQSTYIKKHAPELMRLLLNLLDEAQKNNLTMQNHIGGLEKSSEDMWLEIKRLTAGWEEQKAYIISKEQECARLWDDLQKSVARGEEMRSENEELRDELEKCKLTMDRLFTYLENKKILRLMKLSGLMDLEQFRR